MLSIKPGVRVAGLQPQMAIVIVAVHSLYKKYNTDVVITSGCEGKHSRGSKHYAGTALDFRTRTLTGVDVKQVAKELQEALGEDFDVVVEVDHLHVEYDPKEPLT